MDGKQWETATSIFILIWKFKQVNSCKIYRNISYLYSDMEIIMWCLLAVMLNLCRFKTLPTTSRSNDITLTDVENRPAAACWPLILYTPQGPKTTAAGT